MKGGLPKGRSTQEQWSAMWWMPDAMCVAWLKALVQSVSLRCRDCVDHGVSAARPGRIVCAAASSSKCALPGPSA